jgi:hypothetical protein
MPSQPRGTGLVAAVCVPLNHCYAVDGPVGIGTLNRVAKRHTGRIAIGLAALRHPSFNFASRNAEDFRRNKQIRWGHADDLGKLRSEFRRRLGWDYHRSALLDHAA